MDVLAVIVNKNTHVKEQPSLSASSPWPRLHSCEVFFQQRIRPVLEYRVRTQVGEIRRWTQINKMKRRWFTADDVTRQRPWIASFTAVSHRELKHGWWRRQERGGGGGRETKRWERGYEKKKQQRSMEGGSRKKRIRISGICRCEWFILALAGLYWLSHNSLLWL